MIKSPVFYMGNKFDMLDTLLMYFPKSEDVNNFIDLFGGSSVVSVNVPYKNVHYNELNENTYKLVEMFKVLDYAQIIGEITHNIGAYNLPRGYNKLREHYNNHRNILDLYTLTYYSFSNLFRFNNKGEFNMPVGNQKFTLSEHGINIKLYQDALKEKSIKMTNDDAFNVMKEIKENDNHFIYLDPPYLNTTAVYNEKRANGGWDLEDDLNMFSELERLDKLGVKWAMSNVLENKGVKNDHLRKWAEDNNFQIIHIDEKNYSALGKGNAKSVEVLIVNYRTPFERLSIFDF